MKNSLATELLGEILRAGIHIGTSITTDTLLTITHKKVSEEMDHMKTPVFLSPVDRMKEFEKTEHAAKTEAYGEVIKIISIILKGVKS